MGSRGRFIGWWSGLSADKLICWWWYDLLLGPLVGSLCCPECGILSSAMIQLLCDKASLFVPGCGLCWFPWGVPWVGLEHVPWCGLVHLVSLVVVWYSFTRFVDWFYVVGVLVDLYVRSAWNGSPLPGVWA